ncbi:hypothetical protein [Rhodococcus erythropolis]|uniref:hypothetical protein n=1 Tax=Rhodococcus erythropolis TaxID=1833 RepID=UPI001BE787F0|nr:hypothetical protein [Rhodococcus erythropolis]MBT2269793.1 hypothetical protein [Rhodococcus erythropolis]
MTFPNSHNPSPPGDPETVGRAAASLRRPTALYAASGVIGILVIALAAVTIAYLRADVGETPVAALPASTEVATAQTSAVEEGNLDQSPGVLASPVMDDSGFVGTHAQCDGEPAAVGRTAESLVVICETPGSGYEYRAVRLSDGATVTVDDTRNDGYAFSAWNGEVTYTVSSGGLGIASNNQLIASEPMLEYRGPMLDPNLGVTAQQRPSLQSAPTTQPTRTTVAPPVSTTDYPAAPLAGQGSGNGELRFTATGPWHIDYNVICADNRETDGSIDVKSVMADGSESRLAYGLGLRSGSGPVQGPSTISGSSEVRRETGPTVVYVYARSGCSWQLEITYD